MWNAVLPRGSRCFERSRCCFERSRCPFQYWKSYPLSRALPVKEISWNHVREFNSTMWWYKTLICMLIIARTKFERFEIHVLTIVHECLSCGGYHSKLHMNPYQSWLTGQPERSDVHQRPSSEVSECVVLLWYWVNMLFYACPYMLGLDMGAQPLKI